MLQSSDLSVTSPRKAGKFVLDALLELGDDRISHLLRTVVGNSVSEAQPDPDLLLRVGFAVFKLHLCASHIHPERRASPSHIHGCGRFPKRGGLEHGALGNLELLGLVVFHASCINPFHRVDKGRLPSFSELFLVDFVLKHTVEVGYKSFLILCILCQGCIKVAAVGVYAHSVHSCFKRQLLFLPSFLGPFLLLARSCLSLCFLRAQSIPVLL